MQKIYVRLLEEGTTVYRQVLALQLSDSTFVISDSNEFDAGDEVWEFPPGSIVIVEAVEIGGSRRLLATRLAPLVQTKQ